MNKGYYRFPVGSFACTSLSDGGKKYAFRELFANAPGADAQAALRSSGLDADEPFIPYTHLHVDTGDHQILVDTGAGTLFPTTGQLGANMAAAEIDPGEIDTVILTHAHPDHVGGMMRNGGKLAYPNAIFVIADRERAYWYSEEALGADRQHAWFAEFARKNLDPVRERLRAIEFAVERVPLFSGVSLWRSPGHTPGHMVVAFESAREELLYIGDVAITPIHLEHPEWLPVFDIEPANAAVSKRLIFDFAADRDCLVMGQHFSPFPSLGRVVRRAEGWRWNPVEITE